MANPAESSQTVRFGEFELDLRTGELRSDGHHIILQEKPFQILTALLERPGEMVTREELIKRLWPAGTFVDFDLSLNKAVNRLRDALEDSAEQPRFIETLPKRGYRFVAEVTRNDAGPAEVSPTSPAQQHKDAALASGTIRWRSAGVAGLLVIIAMVSYIAWRRHTRAPAPTGRIMMAVLPFQNLTGDPEQEYLTDGLTEETIARLGGLQPERLGVIARTSVMGYKHGDKRLDQIGRELSVQYVLENSLRGSGDHLRATVQLLQVKDQSHLWAQDYDYRPRDILSLEDDVARAVAREIQIRLSPQQQADLTRTRPVNPEAFDAYMEGRFFLDRDSAGDLNSAASYFEQAIQLDSSYAVAWVGLSRALFRQADRGSVPLREGRRQAWEAVQHALALDPNLAEAHASIGQTKREADWDWTGASASLQRALELDPGNSAVLNLAAGLALSFGRFEEAAELVRRAIALDPLNAALRGSLAEICFTMGRLEEAEVHFKKALELDPGLAPNHEGLGLVYLAQGRAQDALTEIEREQMGMWRLQGQAVAYYALRRKKESDTALSELIAKYQSQNAFLIAEVYSFQKEPDQAFKWLDRAYVQHDSTVPETKASTLLQNLRGDPRYIAFLKKLRLPL